MAIIITTNVACNQCGEVGHYFTCNKPNIRGAFAAMLKDQWTVMSVHSMVCPACNGKDESYWDPERMTSRAGKPARHIK